MLRRVLPLRERKKVVHVNIGHEKTTRKKRLPTTSAKTQRKSISKRRSSVTFRISQQTAREIVEIDEFLNRLLKLPNFKTLHRDSIKKYLIDNKETMRHARAITGDFIHILQTETLRPNEKKTGLIASKIAYNCDRNFQNDINSGAQPFCFCCGEPIAVNDKNQPIGVACDHVIPIVTMLMTVTSDTVPNNLHYIHSLCNSNKLNRNIFEVYKNIGLPGGIFKYCQRDNRDKCRDKFLKILSSLTFRPEYDIVYRLNCVPMFNEDIDELKKKYSRFLNDEREAAMILTTLGSAKQEVEPIEKVKSISSRSRSRSSSSSS